MVFSIYTVNISFHRLASFSIVRATKRLLKDNRKALHIIRRWTTITWSVKTQIIPLNKVLKRNMNLECDKKRTRDTPLTHLFIKHERKSIAHHQHCH